MSRNVTILIVILVIVLIAGYLVWLRNKFMGPAAASPIPQVTMIATPTLEPSPSQIASPSATASASGKASPTAKAKTATPAGVKR